MRQAHTVGPKLKNQIHVLLLVLVAYSPALTRPILMTVHAAQRIWLAVKVKSLVLVHAEPAKPQQTRHLINNLAVENQLHQHGGSTAARKWMEHAYNELFAPSAPEWFEQAQVDARQAFTGLLKAEGFI